MPVFYARPEAAGRALSVAAAVGSWDKSGSAGQNRSSMFVDEVRSVITDQVATAPAPLALRLDIALPDTVPLLDHHDLDNFLFPLVPKLTAGTGLQWASVWATKRHGRTSSVVVSQTVLVADPGGVVACQVRTTSSSQSTAFKEEIRNQICTFSPLPDGGVALQLAFTVGPRRSWPNLWKPTIDALGVILGHSPGSHEWNPRDGRITELGLHGVVDPAAGNECVIAIRARPVGRHARHDGRVTPSVK